MLYLGDSPTDMRTAPAAGMIAVGVSWGFRTRDELVEAGASAVLDHPLELLGAARLTRRRRRARGLSASAPASRSSVEERRHERRVRGDHGRPVAVRRGGEAPPRRRPRGRSAAPAAESHGERSSSQ